MDTGERENDIKTEYISLNISHFHIGFPWIQLTSSWRINADNCSPERFCKQKFSSKLYCFGFNWINNIFYNKKLEIPLHL